MIKQPRAKTYLLSALLLVSTIIVFTVSHNRDSCVCQSSVTSHDNDNRPVVSREQPSYQIDDLADDGSNSFSNDSKVDTGIAYDQKRENTNQIDFDRDSAYAIKRTSYKDKILRPWSKEMNFPTIQLTPDVNKESTTNRESGKETDKLYSKRARAKTINTYTMGVELKKNDVSKKDSAYDQQPWLNKNSITAMRQESTTTTARPDHDDSKNEPVQFGKEVGNAPKLQPKYNNMKTLLWYGFHPKSMRSHTMSIGFSQCEYKNCQYKSYLCKTDTEPTKPFNADAVLIQSSGIYYFSPPPRRDENQVFVLAVRDAFVRTQAVSDKGTGMKWLDLFNWTMTYRLDSDIVYKYANVLERQNKTNIANKNYERLVEEKVNKAVWFVSHCRTKSRREHYVREMQKVMEVDIFGGCGVEQPCPKQSKNIDECVEQTALKYKFYLAFENTLVEDYITEKVFKWFNRDIIVVVRGGSNYSRILPPGTFVDAGDFKSPIKLGKYLVELAQDKERYTDYLKRKDNYYSTTKLVPAQEANCKLCEYLNNLDSHRKNYNNIIEWWLKSWRNYNLQPGSLEGWPRNSDDNV